MAATTVTGADIAAAGVRYKGQGYVYSGTGARPGDWDCSSFASYVLGHDLGLGLPGGSWTEVTRNGTMHGPVVVSYATWGGAVTVPEASATPGDLVLFVGIGTGGHMGIVLGADKMVSALDSSQGTLISPINGYGPPGAPIVYRRVTAAAAGPIPAGGGTGAAAGGWGTFLGAVLAGLVVGVGAIGVVLGAAAAAAAGVVWLGRRAAREVGS